MPPKYAIIWDPNNFVSAIYNTKKGVKEGSRRGNSIKIQDMDGTRNLVWV